MTTFLIGGTKIEKVRAREILDSRGNPTVEAVVELGNGVRGVGAVPSGASTGAHEALELRDGDDSRYKGRGVLKAVDNVNEAIAPRLHGKHVESQEEIDYTMIELDASENKSNLGANAILAVSIACAHAAATAKRQFLYEYIRETYDLKEPLRMPYPYLNVVNGGKHADNGLSIQEFMIVPKQDSFKERIRVGAEVFYTLKDVLKHDGYSSLVGDEGGYAPVLESNGQAFDLLMSSIERAGYVPGQDVNLAIDAAASEFYNAETNKYDFALEKVSLTAEELTHRYKEWLEKYPIISIEDGLAEDDWDGWAHHTRTLGNRVQLVGDDNFVTNIKRLEQGVQQGIANAVLIKPNQIGTISETIECVKFAKKNSYKCVVSNRSGETNDTTIADLAVAVASDIKTGSLSRGERLAKYNRLMEIEDGLS
ncbi:MAG: phosphopyruvate hydratase [Candidatus Kerfeldbacteria bacterium]|nr:phosphopyruvate hydratase [Candidatus Kerfeldbacteria bacterium]